MSWLIGIWSTQPTGPNQATTWVTVSLLMPGILTQEFWYQARTDGGALIETKPRQRAMAFYHEGIKRLCVDPQAVRTVPCFIEGEIQDGRVVWESKAAVPKIRYIDTRISADSWRREFMICDEKEACREREQTLFVRQAGSAKPPVPK